MNDPPTELVGFGEGIWRASSCRLGMNDPPTALVGFGEGIWRASSCRLGMNDPPTALVGFGEGEWRASSCRLYMNDPPTELVGFGEGIWRASLCRSSLNNSPTVFRELSKTSFNGPGSKLTEASLMTKSNARWIVAAMMIVVAPCVLCAFNVSSSGRGQGGKPVDADSAIRLIAAGDSARNGGHRRLREMLRSTAPGAFHSALDSLIGLDEPGTAELWREALANPNPDLQREAWREYARIWPILARNQSAPRIVLIAASTETVERICRAVQLENTVWLRGDNETVAGLSPYSLDRLRSGGVNFEVLFDSVAEWRTAASSGDQLAAEITPAYQSGRENQRSQIRIAVIDLARKTAPAAGYSDWLGDGENIIARSESRIAYLDVFQSDGSADSIAAHIEDQYARRGYALAGFFTAEEFRTEIGRFFPGKEFNAGRATPEKSSGAINPALSNGRFHNYQGALTEFTQLAAAHPDIAQLVNLGPTYEGRQIFGLKIGKDPGVNDPAKPDVLITGCHHAREWISVEPPVYFAKQLINGYSTDDSMKYMVDHLQIWIVPIANPDGLNFSQGSANDQLDPARLWRKNRRPITNSANCFDGVGVDLNRNYGFQWRLDGDRPCPSFNDDSGASDDPSFETYRGPAPNSELEVQALNVLTGDPNHHFRSRIDYHNFSELILYPWGHQYGLAGDHTTLTNLGKRMSDVVLETGREYYKPEQAIYLYITTGTSTDYAYGVDHTPAPFVVEVRPNCCSFNVPENEITPVAEENWAGARMLLNWTAGPPILQSVKAYQQTSDGSFSKLVYSAHWAEQQNVRQLIVDSRFPGLQPGKLQVQLTFSKPMDAAVTPMAAIGRGGAFNELTFSVADSSEGWKRSVYQNDMWIGEVTLPPDDDRVRQWRLSVSAADGVPLKLDARPATIATYTYGLNQWQFDEDAAGQGGDGGTDINHILSPSIRGDELVIYVASPRGGERYAGGDSYTVSWSLPVAAGFLPGPQELLLSTDAGLSFAPLVTGIAPNVLKATVTMPRISANASRLRVTARDNGKGDVIFGESEASFTIGSNVGGGVDVTSVSSQLVEEDWTDAASGLSGSGKIIINLLARNRSNVSLANPFLRVVDLTKGNVLLSRDSNTNPGFTAIQSLDAGGDGMLSPGETIQARLVVGLVKRKKFVVSVNAYGVPFGAVGEAEPVVVWQGKPR